MADVLVTHVIKSRDSGAREVITALGNPNTPQGGWRWETAQVIASLDAGTNTFFVREPSSGKRYDLAVRRSDEGAYLVTIDDGRIVDQLSTLSEFTQESA